MKQSNVIFFFLFAGWFIFITLRGELPAYLAVLGIGEGSMAGQAAQGAAAAATGNTTQLGAVGGAAVGALASAATGGIGGAISGAIGAGAAAGAWDNTTNGVSENSSVEV